MRPNAYMYSCSDCRIQTLLNLSTPPPQPPPPQPPPPQPPPQPPQPSYVAAGVPRLWTPSAGRARAWPYCRSSRSRLRRSRLRRSRLTSSARVPRLWTPSAGRARAWPASGRATHTGQRSADIAAGNRIPRGPVRAWPFAHLYVHWLSGRVLFLLRLLHIVPVVEVIRQRPLLALACLLLRPGLGFFLQELDLHRRHE